MNCPYCNGNMKEGYLYSSKDGAFSFSEEVPSAFSKASNAPGFIKITNLKSGGRAHIKAHICETCRKIVCDY